MKQYPVLNDFIDRYTKEYYRKGSMYSTNDAERAEELQQKGFLGDEIKQTTTKKGKGKNVDDGRETE
ncbi:hypothetical protein [Parageobacillus thermoglucosidasius]|uniref:hypothetical protein n=1 Tax=Parageobacillus thermoglucosidasius TaxID=1426 RepID=UPI000B54B617|nr:hypothetical protein [Parageobacillus thermoglucosidasius]MBY6269323.1 hypothetical protein [Parageobacillus thermoglucosidasius]OUM84942.1 MAG: hypothetical protein BAA00_02480 [Parageobacillus thermoglucosidasius]